MLRGLARWIGVPALLLAALPAAPALAAGGTATLQASPSEVTYGDATQLTGTVSPPGAGTVDIVDTAANTTVAAGDPDDATGTFSVSYAPTQNVTLVARWQGGDSAPVTVGVHVDVSVSIRKVWLFNRAPVFGRIDPPHPGAPIHVELYRGTNLAQDQDLPTANDGTFQTRFRLMRPGRYRATATFTDADGLHLDGQDATRRHRTPLPSLEPGDHGPKVRLLEWRLRGLHYRHPKPDRRYDERTGDAVLAFRKVQGVDRLRTVTESTWRQLADPKRPHPQATKPAYHFEVDQTKQVMYRIRNGRIATIFHVSTGAGGATHDGIFRVYRKLAGTSGGGLYYPSYFDGLRAVHGWPEVPTYNASHGCVRVPMWTAVWIFDRLPMGTQIRIYHS